MAINGILLGQNNDSFKKREKLVTFTLDSDDFPITTASTSFKKSFSLSKPYHRITAYCTQGKVITHYYYISGNGKGGGSLSFSALVDAIDIAERVHVSCTSPSSSMDGYEVVYPSSGSTSTCYNSAPWSLSSSLPIMDASLFFYLNNNTQGYQLLRYNYFNKSQCDYPVTLNLSVAYDNRAITLNNNSPGLEIVEPIVIEFWGEE